MYKIFMKKIGKSNDLRTAVAYAVFVFPPLKMHKKY